LTALLLVQVELSSAATVRGTVVDHTGAPIAGAIVWTRRSDFPSELKAQQVLSDDQGGFAFVTQQGLWTFWARRGDEGLGNTWPIMVNVIGSGDPRALVLRLREASRLRGRLLDAETGQPVAGGRVATDDARLITADPKGRFDVPALSMAAHEACVLGPGHERLRVRFDTTARPDAELEIWLPAAERLVGRVVDESGAPIAGSTVGRYLAGGDQFAGSILWERCGPDGRFTWDRAHLGRQIHLMAHAPGCSFRYGEGRIADHDDPPAELEFVLKREPDSAAAKAALRAAGHRDITGVVSAAGRPLKGAVVFWVLAPGMGTNGSQTDADGRFCCKGVPGKEGMLSVAARGLVPAFPVVPAEGDREINVVLEPGQTVLGQVRDDTGKPLEGVIVVPSIPPLQPSKGIPIQELAATTDAEGRFAIEGMPADRHPTFTFHGEGVMMERDRMLEPGDGANNIIVLTAVGAIRGRVVDLLGQPVRNFRVQLEMPERLKPGENGGGFVTSYTSPGISFTSEDGQFLASGLIPAYVQRVRISARGFGQGEAERVVASPLNHVPSADALTIALGLGHALRLVAFQSNGKPVTGARVTLIDRDPGRVPLHDLWEQDAVAWDEMVQGRTGNDGWVGFPSLPFSKAIVVVRARGYTRRVATWRGDEPEIKVDLEPEAVLTGDIRGQPVGDLTVGLNSRSDGFIRAQVDPRTGRYIFAEVTGGAYTFVIQRSGGGSFLYQEQLTLESGKTFVRDVDLPKP
jgi:hypothetical protein